jgi:phage terminase small subunit
MALRGRKPTSTADKILLGNPGGRPLKTVVPKARAGRIAVPPEVEADPKAQEYWDHFTTTTAPGHLMPVDGPMLAELCYTMSLLHSARAKLRVTGDVMKSKDGNFYQSPWLTVVNRQREAMIKLMSNLSLSVAERNRMGGHDVEDEDPVAHFFDA